MYEVVVAINIGIFTILALSVNIITGYIGQPTLGHAAFFGIGAYASAILTGRYGVPFLLSLPLSHFSIYSFFWCFFGDGCSLSLYFWN